MSEPVEAVVINQHSQGIKRNRNAFLTVLETGCLRSEFLQGNAPTEGSFGLGDCQLPIVCVLTGVSSGAPLSLGIINLVQQTVVAKSV